MVVGVGVGVGLRWVGGGGGFVIISDKMDFLKMSYNRHRIA